MIVLFEDEITLHLTPTLYRQWGLQGRQPLIVSPGNKHQKFHLFGALNVVSGRTHYRKAPTINARHFCAFLRQLLRAYPGTFLVLILDGAVWHRAKLLKALLHETPTFQLFLLPPYSPDPNPIELFWKGLRKKVTHNHCYLSLPELKSALNRFYRRKRSRHAMGRIVRLCQLC